MRHVITAVVVVAVESYLYWRYRALGAEFHFWLHGLFGAAIGVATTTGWALLRRRRPGAVWGPGFAGRRSPAPTPVSYTHLRAHGPY